jgi:Asp-tRNA(Asn)/Glu-tRNA(Gln) amidotransferase A subunit family amidase
MTSKPERRSYLAAAKAFASGTDGPRAFLERCIAEIDARENDVQAFVCLDLAAARRAADASEARWRSGRPLSAIDGMPVGVKDIIETADMPTGMGSPLFTGWQSGRDSASVTALRQAGAVIVGKTVTTEFAASVPGPTRNPWDLARTPGGSSSGSAAGVGCGFLSAGLGTQVVGSIIRPAGFCGVVGFKPSLGGINRGGSHDFASQSCQGVLGASLADTWAVAIEIVNRAGGDPGWPGLQGPVSLPQARRPRTLAFLETTGWAKTSGGLKETMRAALSKLEQAGIAIVTRATSEKVEAVEKVIPQAPVLTRAINAWEGIWPLNIYRDRDATKLSKELHAKLGEAEAMSVNDYRAALTERARIRALYAALAEGVDACITLSAPGPAPLGLASTGDMSFAVPSSLLGVPALTQPLLAEDGLPVGLQLMGFEQKDADLFAVAGAVAQVLSPAG